MCLYKKNISEDRSPICVDAYVCLSLVGNGLRLFAQPTTITRGFVVTVVFESYADGPSALFWRKAT